MEEQRTCFGEAPLPVSTLSEPLVSGKGAELATADDLEAAQLPSYGGASFSRTCLNLTNAVSGIGVLSMPYAVAQGGWLSLALFALIGALCYYTGTLIGEGGHQHRGCCQHGSGGLQCAVLRLPHVVHRMVPQRHGDSHIPLPLLPQDLQGRGDSPHRDRGDHWYPDDRSVRRRHRHLHFCAANYRHFLR
ncbi:hypothetical protein C2845_PM07G14540 [Panicum miliaceum]|uniref:Amino acid transporter transmembrane domain-containing protein n=1 Tax=Panicum miliaceum TaxID=4540 RepID=A0A3L6SJT0_PANMI|nr:hypothetical protein C2845_PM07G14540 [Panicum miliaceum]